MSDTPIQEGLDEKESVRLATFMVGDLGTFREKYNDAIRDMDAPDDREEAFLLDSDSEAFRRAVDIGIERFFSTGIPYGFSFDTQAVVGENETLICPECGAEDGDLPMFRLGGGGITDDGAIRFDKVRCMNCNATDSLDEMKSASPLL